MPVVTSLVNMKGGVGRTVALMVVIPMALTAQLVQRGHPVTLKNWQAPLHWQPTQAEREASGTQQAKTTADLAVSTDTLVFVAMTPCRIVDTRASQAFSWAFGAPSLIGGAPGRTFPIQSNTTCPIPSIAQAYSFNLSVVPPAAGGYITAYPTGQALPLAATSIWAQALLVSNAAVVAAGANGSVDVYASANTDLVIDINGYYVPGASGTGYRATSATSLNIAMGSHTFSTQAGLAYTAGARARASSNATPANYMEGLVTSYTGTSLTIDATTIGGSGTASDWNINVAGNVGATGATGPQGAAGPQGATGPQGPAGPVTTNTFGVCISNQSYQPSCHCTTELSAVPIRGGSCSAAANTGSCTASAASNSYGICCVCR